MAAQSFAANIYTDMTDYPVGATVEISGVEFLAGETVTLQITELDGTPVTDDGGLPWDVISDGTGDFGSEWLTSNTGTGGMLVLTSVGQTSGYTATTVFISPGTNLDQLHNGTTTSDPKWANGNINSNNSCYSEGRTVPYRAFITGNEAATSHYFTIEMEWTKGGVHALDYLTNYDATEDSAIWLAGGPCGDSGTSAPSGCSTPTDSLEFNDPRDTLNYTGSIPFDFFTTVNPGFTLDGPRYLKAYNATIDSTGAYFFGGTASDRTLSLKVYYTADTAGSVGFFWGGHLARGDDDTWYAGNGSASVGGAPYHMRMKNYDGGGGAGQDKSIQNGTICLPPLVSILSTVDSLCADSISTYVCRDTSTADSWLWTITNGTIIGDNTLDSVVFYVPTGVNPGESVTVELFACNTSGGCPGDNCCANASISIPVKSCNAPPTATCPGDTTIFLCDLTQVCIDGFVCDDPDGNLSTCTVSLGTKTGSTVCFTPTGAGTYTITLIATDSFGQADTCTATVTIILNAPPVITCPADATIDCTASTDPSNTGSATATDDYSTPTITYTDIITPGACPQEYTITRKWYAVDDCNDTSMCIQTISVEDNTPPVISCPPDKTIECTVSTNPASTGSATATDNCDANVAITYVDVVTPGNCPQEETITRTWTATDDCGNSSTCDQIINVEDTTPPSITCPADATIECDQPTDPGTTGTATANDNCDPAPGLTFADVVTPGSCDQEFTITRTWTATDACGNSKTCDQIINVVDTTPPQITCPADATIECDQPTDPPNAGGSATATDNCDPSPVISYADVVTPGNCDQASTITRTWTSTDDCGNSSTCNQIINVVDTTPPQITCPADATIECDQPTDPPNAGGSATATDNCDPQPVITYADVVTPGSCDQEETITRTWTATDDCGNSSSCDQIINVVDTTPPQITCPADLTIDCDASTDPDSTGSATATDNCDPAPVISYSDAKNYGIITRTWAATDDCGNSSSCDQIITLDDFTPPTITCPPEITMECDASIHPDATGWATANDNCDDTLDITWSDSEVSANCPLIKIITRTWRATDNNGLYTECNQTINIEDTSPPVITCPPNVNVYCGGSTDSDSTGTATAYDSCSANVNIVISFTDVVNGDVITRTWMATDDCGNFSTCDQIITNIPNAPPVATCPGDSTMFRCNLDDICIDGFSCSDPDGNLATCVEGGGTLNGTEICFTPVEGENILTLTATDSCGLIDVCTTKVTVVLNRPPTASTPQAIDTFVCTLEEICLIGFDCDDPDGNLAECRVVGRGLTNGTLCFMPVAGPNTLTLIATDSCGLADTSVTTVNVTLNQSPTASCPSDTTITVYGFPVQVCIDGFACDDPDGNLVSCDINGTPLSGPYCFTTDHEGIFTLTLTATDSCGRVTTCYTEVFVKYISTCPIIKIEKTHDSYQGHFEYVSITIEDGSPDMGGFDFLIAYDASAIVAMEVTPGQLLDDCGWEYFTYRHGANGNCGDACPSGMLRIIAIADMNDGPNHPLCFGPANANVHELAELKFLVSSDYNLNGQYVPIYFFWGDCGDNLVSTMSGDTAFIDSKIYDPFGVLIWDEEDDILFPESDRIPWVGAPDYCLNPIPGKPSAIRCIEFVNGGIDIIPVEAIDDRGDINLNGVPNEIADATVFTNYFIYGFDAFVINVEGQKAATDINADGMALSVADLVYLMRIIVGDALPIPPRLNSGLTAEFTMSNGAISVDAELGAACLLLKGNHEVTLGADAVNMSILSRFDGINTRVLIYSFERDHACQGEILRTDGEMIFAEAADYYGNGYKSSLIVPQFVVNSYPNPFNPTTTIIMSLPVASDWSISIYNVVGQKVAEFDGTSEAGPVSVNWDASGYASGVYFYKAQAGIYSATKKMMLLK